MKAKVTVPMHQKNSCKQRLQTNTMRSAVGVFLTLLLYLLPAAGQADATIFASGLNGPVKLDITNRGSLLVSESGSGTNDGRLSLIDRFGDVWPLLTGLPSGIDVTGAATGPTGVQLRNCCLVELVIGDGDTTRVSPAGPPQNVPNPTGTVSPLFSSLLRVQFSRPPEKLTGPFELTAEDHEALADGQTIRLQNTSGENAWIWLAADIKDFRPDAFTNVRNANPFAIAPSNDRKEPIIVSSGGNSLLQVRRSGPPRTLLRFAPVPNAPGTLPPVSEAVPTSIRQLHGNQYLVGLLTGVPFVPGSASIRLVNIRKGTQSVFISGLTSVTDVLRVGRDTYVLEFSTNLPLQEPGRLLRFNTPTSEPEVLAADLIAPSGMAYSPREHAIFIAEIATGLIKRVGL